MNGEKMDNENEWNILKIYPGDSLFKMIQTMETYEATDPDLKKRRLDLISKGGETSRVILNFYLYASECAKYAPLNPLSGLLARLGDEHYERRRNDDECYYVNDSERHLISVLKQVKK